MSAIWREPDDLEKRKLFAGIIHDAQSSERVVMLFSLMSRMLRGIGDNPSRERMASQGRRIVAAIDFLRDSLADKPADPFHGAFKRFYNHLHRQVIDAIRDYRPEGFRSAGRSIGILISEAHADAFVTHFLEQSELKDHRLMFLLDRLFHAAPDIALEPVAAPHKRTFIPLRTL